MKSLPARLAIAFLLLTVAIANAHGQNDYRFPAFFKVGRRGTRGLMPENTIPAMYKAITCGANTVEIDVHITKDKQVIVYHDESVNPDYTVNADGSRITPGRRKQYTFYQMPYRQARQFVIGTLPYKPFPQQQALKTYAPLMGQLIDSVEQFTKTHRFPPVYYLIEIKAAPETDGFTQPGPKEFVRLVMQALIPKNIRRRVILQSFDKRQLIEIHKTYPQWATGFLVGNSRQPVSAHLAELGFTPNFYNPVYTTLSPQLLSDIHSNHMLCCPWTVNTPTEIAQLKAMGVNGIITDYPNLL